VTEQTERRIVETTFPVRYAETDQMQIVHHANYVVWMEEGRSEFMRASGADYAEVERGGHLFAVTGVQVRYLASAHYGERVTVRTWIEELRSRTLTFGYEIVNAENGTLLVTGQSEHVCINREGQVTRIPEQWHELLASQTSTPRRNDAKAQSI
jgi:acyl-CoA thioester hydrolase